MESYADRFDSFAGVIALPSKGKPEKPVHLLSSTLPSGINEKGKRTPLKAGELTTMFTTVMSDPVHDGLIRWNLMSQDVEINGVCLSPHEQECIYIPIQQRGYDVNKSDAKDALAAAAQENAFHPVRDYLDTIRHGERTDITRLASTFLRPGDSNGPQTIYDRMLHKTLVAAVKRAYEPGCQHDTCLVLKGDQGIKKTSFWRVLFGPYFAIFRGKIGDKDALLNVHRAWGLELGELDGITSLTHAGHLKNFLSTNEDTFRAPYASKAAPCPRPSIFVGSCNRGDFLYDDTGERRWWIIPCDLPGVEKIDTDELSALRDAIWAQATADYFNGFQTYLEDADDRLNDELNRDYTADNILEEPISRFLQEHAGAEHISPKELLDAVERPGMTTQAHQRLIKDAMTRAGWGLKRPRADKSSGPRPRMWCRY